MGGERIEEKGEKGWMGVNRRKREREKEEKEWKEENKSLKSLFITYTHSYIHSHTFRHRQTLKWILYVCICSAYIYMYKFWNIRTTERKNLKSSFSSFDSRGIILWIIFHTLVHNFFCVCMYRWRPLRLPSFDQWRLRKRPCEVIERKIMFREWREEDESTKSSSFDFFLLLTSCSQHISMFTVINTCTSFFHSLTV